MSSISFRSIGQKRTWPLRQHPSWRGMNLSRGLEQWKSNLIWNFRAVLHLLLMQQQKNSSPNTERRPSPKSQKCIFAPLCGRKGYRNRRNLNGGSAESPETSQIETLCPSIIFSAFLQKESVAANMVSPRPSINSRKLNGPNERQWPLILANRSSTLEWVNRTKWHFLKLWTNSASTRESRKIAVMPITVMARSKKRLRDILSVYAG